MSRILRLVDDAQEKPRPEPPREVSPRDDVRVVGSPVRCPFCHEDVAVEGEWSACSRCLARHHQPCWTEGGRCASCGHDGAVRHGGEAPKKVEDARRRSLGAFAVALLAGVIAPALIVFFVRSGRTVVEPRRATPRPAAEQPVAQPRPAARHERDGALVVEDGRGNFVAVFEAEDEVIFGFGVVLQAADGGQFVVLSPDGYWAGLRPLQHPLTVYEAPSSLSHFARGGMTVREVEEVLRRTPPSDLDLRELSRRARAD